MVHMSEQVDRRMTLRMVGIAFGLALLASFVAYYPCLDNFFHEIDDPLHLLGASIDRYQSPHFRPMHALWNRTMFLLFGLDPRGWYLSGILLHAVNSTLLGGFTWTLSRNRLLSLAALLVFSTLFAPNQAIQWIGAHNSLILGFFVLLACWSWVLFLSRGQKRYYLASMTALVFAMLSKESCVVLGPFFVLLDILVRGPRKILQRHSLVRYLPFVILAVAYLLVAFRPGVWERQGASAHYEFGLDALPKAWASMGHLWVPTTVDRTIRPFWAILSGILITVITLVLARRFPRHRTLLIFGLLASLVGFVAVLPSTMPILGHRYAYLPGMGVAWLVAAFLGVAWDLVLAHGGRWRNLLGVLLGAGLLGWCSVQVAAIHSVEPWRHEARGELLRASVASASRLILQPMQQGAFEQDPVLLGSELWNGQDLQAAMAVFLGVPWDRMELRRLTWPDEVESLVRAGGDMDPERRPLFAMSPSGEIRRIRDRSALPKLQWEQRARRSKRDGFGRILWSLRFLSDP